MLFRLRELKKFPFVVLLKYCMKIQYNTDYQCWVDISAGTVYYFVLCIWILIYSVGSLQWKDKIIEALLQKIHQTGGRKSGGRIVSQKIREPLYSSLNLQLWLSIGSSFCIVSMNTATRHKLFSKWCEYNLNRKRNLLFILKMDSLQAPTKQSL